MEKNIPQCPSVLIFDVLQDTEEYLSVREIMTAIYEKYSVNYSPHTIVKYIDVLKQTGHAVAETFDRLGDKKISTKVFSIVKPKNQCLD